MNILVALALVALALLVSNYAGWCTGRRIGRREGLMRGEIEASKAISQLIDAGLLAFPPDVNEMIDSMRTEMKKKLG